MKVLLLHPNDSAEVGPWREVRWDWIVDLGWSGRSGYEHLSKLLGCRIFSLQDVLNHEQHGTQVREFLRAGLGQVIDEEGVDWWDVFSPLPYDRIEQALLVSGLARQIPPDAEIAATRPHSLTQGLSVLLGREIKVFVADSGSALGKRLVRYRKAAATFRPSQILQIALDKWDTDFRYRRHISPAASASTQPTILLPSSYVNVSKVQVAYARMLPEQKFLLATTRPSGSHLDRPPNVDLRSLASYAPKPFLPATEKDHVQLLQRWSHAQSKVFPLNEALHLSQQLGVLSEFPAFLRKGLRIRDAWRNVFAREPIQAVLSADENNPYTRLPSLLARSRKIPTLFVDHGALNMTFAVRELISDTYLVQGEMAKDYIVNFCGVPEHRVKVGSPVSEKELKATVNTERRDWIVFFSTNYALSAGRTEVLYRETIPNLCTLARQTQRKVIIKLHPFESFAERSRLVEELLTPEQRPWVELREGSLTPDLLDRAWFTLTVESSVAVESALQGVPCFLCEWFDCSWYEYGTQFAKFSVAQTLNSPENILDIPRLIEGSQLSPTVKERLVQYISPQNLSLLLSDPLARHQ